MIIPPRLRAGDTVGVVATGRKISQAQLDPAIILLTSWGLDVRLADNIFSDRHSYLAGTDLERSTDLQNMLDDAEVKAIFCARGGYGSTRIVDDINFSALAENPKWVIGFSDVTAIHLQLLRAGIASIHGTMPIFFGRDTARESVDSVRRVLFDGVCEIPFEGVFANRPGKTTARVIGGNLSLITDALNTASAPDTDNSILIVEEVDEYFYKLDRMFTQLRRAGKLAKLAGLVIGHMTDIKDSELAFGDTLQDIISNAVRGYDYPVVFSFPSGHEDPNRAWIVGGTATLDVGVNRSSLVYPSIYDSAS